MYRLVILSMLLLLGSSCSKKSDSPLPPIELVSFSPGEGASINDVQATTIRLVYNRVPVVDLSKISFTSPSAPNVNVVTEIEVIGDTLIITNDRARIESGSSYELRFKNEAIKDSAGNALNLNIITYFVEDFIPPAVSSSLPAANASGVPVFPPSIYIVFDEPVKNIVGERFAIKDRNSTPLSNVTPRYAPDTVNGLDTVFIQGHGTLDGGQSYTIALERGAVTDSSGNKNIAVDITFSVRSITSPKYTTVPADGDRNVDVNLERIQLNFGSTNVFLSAEAMRGGVASFLSIDNGATLGAIEFGSGGAGTLPVILLSGLNQVTDYNVRIGAGLFEDSFDNKNEAVSFTFETADNTRPTILITAPSGVTNFRTFSRITQTISEPVVLNTSDFANTIASKIKIVSVADSFDIRISNIEIIGRTMIMDISNAKPSTTYRVIVEVGALLDLSVNANPNLHSESSIITSANLDLPSRVRVEPGELAERVSRTISPIKIHFNGAITLQSSDNISVISTTTMDTVDINTVSVGAGAADSVIEIVLNDTLENFTEYRVEYISSFVRKVSNNQFNVGDAFTFTTIDDIPPAFVSSNPRNGVGDILTTLSQIQLYFNEPINIVDISEVTVSGTSAMIDRIVVQNDSVLLLTLAPTTLGNPIIFNEKETYMITVGIGAINDRHGNQNIQEVITQFTIRDQTPPVLMGTNPESGTSEPSVDRVHFTFNEAIFIRDSSLINLPDGRTISSIILDSNEVTVLFSPEITNVGLYSFGFANGAFSDDATIPNNATEQTIVFNVGDIAPPVVTGISPQELSVVTDSVVTILFDESLDATTVDVTKIRIEGLATSSITSISRSTTNADQIILILNKNRLEGSTTYNLVISPDFVQDLAGNGNTSRTISFSTKDEDAPTVTGSIPATAAEALVTTSKILITFNETISIINSSLVSINNGVVIDRVNLSSQGSLLNNTLEISLLSSLRGNQTYAVIVSQGAVQDLSLNRNSAYRFEFTTGLDNSSPTFVFSNVNAVVPPQLLEVPISLDSIILVYSEDIFINDASKITIVDSLSSSVSIGTPRVNLDTLIIPISGLSLDQQYRVSVTTGAISDFDSNLISTSTLIDFRTLAIIVQNPLYNSFTPLGKVIWAEGSGGGAGPILKPSRTEFLIKAATGGNGSSTDNFVNGTPFSDIIFADGSGGGGGHALNYNGTVDTGGSLGTAGASDGGTAGGGDDFIMAGGGDDIIFADGFAGNDGVGINSNDLAIARLQIGALGGYGGGGASGSALLVSPSAQRVVSQTIGSIGGGLGGGVTNTNTAIQRVESGQGSINLMRSGTGIFASDVVKALGGGGGTGLNGSSSISSSSVGGNAIIASPSSFIGMSGGDGFSGQILMDLGPVNAFLGQGNDGSVLYAKIIEDINFDGTADDSRVWGAGAQATGAGNDTIDGGAGNDVILTMGGSDVVIISFEDSVSANGEVDRILDFDYTIDKIRVLDTNGNPLVLSPTEKVITFGKDNFGEYLSIYLINGLNGKYIYLYDLQDGSNRLALTRAQVADIFTR